MAWDEARQYGRQVAFDDVEIGAADSAGKHAEEDVAGLKLRPRNIFDCEQARGRAVR